MFTPHGTFSPVQLIPFIFILPLIAFWVWMFQDMASNDRLPSSAKDTWTLAFILGNVFTAVVYYATEYRRKS